MSSVVRFLASQKIKRFSEKGLWFYLVKAKGGITLFFVLLFLFAGCAPRKVVQPEAGQKETIQEKAPETKISEPEAITPPSGEVVTEKPVSEGPAVTSPQVMERVAKTEKTEKIEFSDIHFDFDKYFIRDDAKPALEKLALWLKNNPKAQMLIEGHCDERGTNQYNLALGERRALAAKEYLISLGISSSRIDIVTYGEERPLCREHNEECWQLNRRAHFVIHE